MQSNGVSGLRRILMLLERCQQQQTAIASCAAASRSVCFSANLRRKPTPEKLARIAEVERKLREDPPEFGHSDVEKKRGLLRPVHSVETSIRYMKSKAFEETYKGLPVWRWYRRNIKGSEIYQHRPRRCCVDKYNIFRTNNPCPVCRDEYLVLHWQNVELLKMFMVPDADAVLPILRSGLCEDAYMRLQAMILKAKHYGLLVFDVPFRVYDYNKYYPWRDWGEAPEVDSEPKEMTESTAVGSYRQYPEFHLDSKPPYDMWWQRWQKFAKNSYTSY